MNEYFFKDERDRSSKQIPAANTKNAECDRQYLESTKDRMNANVAIDIKLPNVDDIKVDVNCFQFSVREIEGKIKDLN